MGPPLGPGGEDITWPDQVVPRGRKASSTRKIKPQNSNLQRSPVMEIQRQQTSLCGVRRGLSLPGLVLSHTIGNPTQAIPPSPR